MSVSWFKTFIKQSFSQFCNASARHEQQKCNTNAIQIQATQVQHECNTSDTGVTRV